MINIESILYQRPLMLIQKYEFSITFTENEEIHVLPAVVTVTHAEGVTKIEDFAIEGDVPEEFFEVWNPEWAIKQIQFELGEELNKLVKSETF